VTADNHPDPVTEQLLNELPEAREAYDRLASRYEFIEAVIRARTGRGWSQADLGKACGTTQSAIARLESGDQDPKLSTVTQVCHVLGLPLAVGVDRQAG
jgi:HTH-type transcriptional regulator/antitoxin HipB